MISNDVALAAIDSPVRHIEAEVELYDGSTSVSTFANGDRIKEITVERVGEDSKFFGITICQKANVKLIDVNRELDITAANSMVIRFNGVDSLPTFHVTEVNRDEKTNELSITAYDKLNKASSRTVGELEFPAAYDGTDSAVVYDIESFAAVCAETLGLAGLRILNVDDGCFSTVYNGGANFGGDETLRSALTCVAEATQTICYINGDDELVFKRMDRDGEPVLTIGKSKYIELDSKTNRRLATIYSVTELGDDVYASLTETGSTQYVRDNPFWNLRDDIGTLVDNALAAVGGMTINQFECDWRGNFLLEIGDKLGLVTKEEDVVYSYLLDDTISYNGAYSQKSRWGYTDNPSETSDNPTSLGDVIKKTTAKVDKVNQEITLVASKAEENANEIAAIRLDVGSINASVESVQKQVSDNAEYVDGQLSELTKKVEATMTDEEVNILISSTIENLEVQRVTTTTGFTFNEEGLKVSKSNSEMETLITEDGMRISRDGEEVLIANNEGVKAEDLHATTYLIIGVNSRWEDYGESLDRTGCFWIGRTEIDDV